MENNIEFITPVSMRCTQEQYERDLKYSLEKMGYGFKEYRPIEGYEHPILSRGLGAYLSDNVMMWSMENSTNHKGTYFIDHYNPELFLALAAMTKPQDPQSESQQKWVVGEYTKFNGRLAKIEIVRHDGWIWGSQFTSRYRDKDIRNYHNPNHQFRKKPTKEELIEHFTKDKFVLPEKWCVKVTDDNWKELKAWAEFGWMCDTGGSICKYGTDYVTSKKSHFYKGQGYHDMYTEITTEQFRKYVSNENKKEMKKENRFPFTLTEKDAKRIINIACTDWKKRLTSMWGFGLLTSGSVLISHGEYKEMRKACTEDQHELFNNIFGKDSEDKNVFIKKFSTNHIKELSKELFGCNFKFQIGSGATDEIGRDDLHGRSFYVSEDIEIITHNVPSLGGTLIELRKK